MREEYAKYYEEGKTAEEAVFSVIPLEFKPVVFLSAAKATVEMFSINNKVTIKDNIFFIFYPSIIIFVICILYIFIIYNFIL
jgi:hypothetical protein